MATKNDSNNTIVSEVAKLNELFLLGASKSSIPAGTWTSTSSSIIYTYTDGSDLYAQLQTYLRPYSIVASDWNAMNTEINKILNVIDGISLGGIA